MRLIDADALMGKLYDELRDGEVLYRIPPSAIDNAPTIDAVPVVRGRWLPCGFGKEIMCSVCRGELDDVWGYRHCPNCGARMDGE